jgi:hypothetical protein
MRSFSVAVTSWLICLAFSERPVNSPSYASARSEICLDILTSRVCPYTLETRPSAYAYLESYRRNADVSLSKARDIGDESTPIIRTQVARYSGSSACAHRMQDQTKQCKSKCDRNRLGDTESDRVQTFVMDKNCCSANLIEAYFGYLFGKRPA